MRRVIYHLYRVKFIKPLQLSLIDDEITSSDVFRAALSEKPSISFRSNNEWHIGNIDIFDGGLASFAIGRTTKATAEKFDQESGNFVEQVDDLAPFTQVVCDLNLGVIGIPRKIRVAPDIQSIARKLKSLLETTRAVSQRAIEVRVDPIPDPEGFIKKVRSAYAVKYFRVSFTGPNPVDADKYFQKPISVYCQNMNGASGNIEVKGEALNQEFIEDVVVVTAATGNNAVARVQSTKGKQAAVVKLSGDAYSVAVNPDDSRHEVALKVKSGYGELRHRERDQG